MQPPFDPPLPSLSGPASVKALNGEHTPLYSAKKKIYQNEEVYLEQIDQNNGTPTRKRERTAACAPGEQSPQVSIIMADEPLQETVRKA